MKKFFAMLMVCLMLAALAAPCASASGVVRFYIEGPSSAKVGDTFEISVKVSGSYQAHIINLTVSFNKTAVSYKGNTKGPVYLSAMNDGGMCACDVTMSGDAVSIAILMPIDPLSAEGEIVKLSFEVLSTAGSKAKFGLTAEEFGYMPIGQTDMTTIAHSDQGLDVKISGGSGTSPTSVPGPGDHGSASTQQPSQTDGSGKATPTPTADPKATPDPNATEEPAVTDEPVVTEEPTPESTETVETELPTEEATIEPTAEATEEPGGDEEPTRSGLGTKILLGAGGCAIIAGLVTLIVLLAKRSKKEKEE